MKNAVFGLLTLAGFASLPACSAIGSGDYALFRVGFAESESSASCFGEFGQDPNQAEDTSDILGAQTFAVFRAADVYYLEFGDFILTGQKDGDAFTFDGEYVDVEYFGADDANRFVATDSIAIDFTLNGSAITGSFSNSSESTCDGPDCTENDESSCTGTSDFFGTRVDGVDIGHTIDLDN